MPDGHRGKGHPAFTDQEAKDYLRRAGVAITSELAEEFDVSDVAVRKRLKDMPGVDTRKIRNRRVWYVPHDQPEAVHPDGGAGLFAGGLESMISPGALELIEVSFWALVFSVFTLVLSYWLPALRTPGVVFTVIFLFSTVALELVRRRWSHAADPSAELLDVERHRKDTGEDR